MRINMYRLEEVTEENRQWVIQFLRKDAVRNVFALYDLQHETANTKMYAAFEGEVLKGYILTYTGTTFPSAVLEGESEAAKALVKYAPKNSFILHTPRNLMPIVTEKFPNTKCYTEDWMLVKRGHAIFFKSPHVRKLKGLEDAEKLMMLFATNTDRPRESLERNFERVSKTSIYGVFINGELISCASVFIKLPEVWLIGGVYTRPNHRKKGYATLATSAITEEALKNAECASLFVRNDNYSAIRVYEKIGYKKIGEKIWVDVGTGLKP
ncbi:MAG: GNAT family N-acetyltransferase [Candidatus Bathyarchaeales archaeon]